MLQAIPLLAVSALLIGRVFLGVGESFTATGATLWGIKTVGAIHTSRVISWNGVATYVAMAVGAPLGVMLNKLFWHQRFCRSGSAGCANWPAVCPHATGCQRNRRSESAVSCGSAQDLALRAGIGAGYRRFGVIATFITLYFSAHHWQGAPSPSLSSASVLFVYA